MFWPLKTNRLLLACMLVGCLVAMVFSGAAGASNASDSGTVTFAVVATFNLDRVGQGTILLDGDAVALPYQATYAEITTVELAAIADSGWTFSHWTGDFPDGEANEPVIEVTIDGNKELIAHFTPATYTLTVNIQGEGSVQVDGVWVELPYTETYAAGATVELLAVPRTTPRWIFARWEVNGVNYGIPRLTIVVDADIEATAVFIRVPPSTGPQFNPPAPSILVEPDPPLGAPNPTTSATVRPDQDTTVGLELFRVFIPAGALDKEAIVRITALLEDGWPVVPDSLTHLAFIYEVVIEVEDGPVTDFRRDILGIFLVPPDTVEGLDTYQVFVFRWHEGLGEWLALPTEIGDENGWVTLTGSVDSLSELTATYDPKFPVLKDIQGHWAWSEVLKMVSLGTIDGFADQTFRPDQYITRAEFAKMVVLSAGLPIPQNLALPFVDLADTPEWATPYIAAAWRAGVVVGYPDNTFRPGGFITRAEMAAMLHRALVSQAPVAPRLPFIDTIPPWARGYIGSVTARGLIRGYPDGRFQPGGLTTRAHACAVMWRTVELLYK